jgi:hypothetical protein
MKTSHMISKSGIVYLHDQQQLHIYKYFQFNIIIIIIHLLLVDHLSKPQTRNILLLLLWKI